MNSALESTEFCRFFGHPLPFCNIAWHQSQEHGAISGHLLPPGEKALQGSLLVMSVKCSFSTDGAYLMQYFAIKFIYKSFSINELCFTHSWVTCRVKRQMKWNMQKKTHNIVTKEHYVNYCGSLCNPEDAFVLEAFIFCAAANVHVSHALNQAHRRGKEGIIC